jgi:asparagine synthase (glutamine-hydrolysing)
MSREFGGGAKVVLSGEGADELFGGYGRIFRSALDYQRLQLLKSGDGDVSGSARDALEANLHSKYAGPVAGDELSHFLQQYEYCSFDERSHWLNADLWSSTDNDRYCRQVFAEAFREAESLELHQRFMWVFEKLHLVGLLQRLDSSTMAAGVEGRVPFVDHELVEFVVSMPLRYKLRWRSQGHMLVASLLNSDQISETYDVTKYILRAAYKDILPDAVIERRKVGFPVPLQRMMGAGFIERARDVLLDPSIARGDLFDGPALQELLKRPDVFDVHRTALKVWMLLNLAIWHNEVWG